MIRKETRIINGREAHLYYDEERQVYLVADDLMEVFLGLYENADKLVKELAEEQNNGWIDCSKSMPEEWVDVLVTTINGEVYRACYTGYNFDDCETEYFHSLHVVAWQPLPEPYQPKEDKENA